MINAIINYYLIIFISILLNHTLILAQRLGQYSILFDLLQDTQKSVRGKGSQRPERHSI